MSNSFSEKRVLVTGAGGYIGRHVVKALLDLGVQVTAVARSNEGIDERADFVEIDIFGEHENLYEQLLKPDICLHMAWKDGFIHNSAAHLKYLYNHYLFLTNLVESGVKHIAVMGTMHEIGFYEGQIDENTPTNPISFYGIAKNTLRQSLQSFLSNKDVAFQWIRAYYIYGDDSKNNSIFTKIIQTVEEGKTVFPFNSGKNKYDFITVDELSYQIARTVTQTQITGIINCSSGTPISLKEKVEEFIKQNNYGIKLEYGAFPDRPYDSTGVWGSNEKILRILSET